MSNASFRRELAAILSRYAGTSADGRKTISHETRKFRTQTIRLCFKQLGDLKQNIASPNDLKGRHIAALAEQWVGQNLSVSTIHNRLSALRWFSRCIGKAGMVKTPGEYPGVPAKRSLIAQTDHSISAQGIDVDALLERVEALEPLYKHAIMMQVHFGLRVQESLMLRPHICDYGTYLSVEKGAKGGRSRVVPIDTPEARSALDAAKAAVGRNDSLIPRSKTLKSGKKRYYYVMSRVGLTKAELGATSHWIRHKFLQDEFTKLTGALPPVKGGRRPDREIDLFGRNRVARLAGHGRPGISNAYLGKAGGNRDDDDGGKSGDSCPLNL